MREDDPRAPPADLSAARAEAIGLRSKDAARRAAHEHTLHEALRSGDELAFRSIMRLYHGRLVRFAHLFVASHAVAEEVAQETWLVVASTIAAFEARSSLKTWIFRILSNRAKTRAEREGRFVPFSALAQPLEHEPAVDPARFRAGAWADPPERWEENTPETLLLRREVRVAISHALEALPVGQRAVVTLRDLEGFDADEVCSILQISETNQRVLLHRARAGLRRMLEAHFRGVE